MNFSYCLPIDQEISLIESKSLMGPCSITNSSIGYDWMDEYCSTGHILLLLVPLITFIVFFACGIKFNCFFFFLSFKSYQISFFLFLIFMNFSFFVKLFQFPVGLKIEKIFMEKEKVNFITLLYRIVLNSRFIAYLHYLVEY